MEYAVLKQFDKYDIQDIIKEVLTCSKPQQ